MLAATLLGVATPAGSRNDGSEVLMTGLELAELQALEAAQVSLTSQLDEQAEQIARLTREIDSLRPGTAPAPKPRVGVAVTATARQERHLSESASCCRWTNSDACGSDVTEKW